MFLLYKERSGCCFNFFHGKLSTCSWFAVDHSLFYLRPVDEDDNTYINAVSVNVSYSSVSDSELHNAHAILP